MPTSRRCAPVRLTSTDRAARRRPTSSADAIDDTSLRPLANRGTVDRSPSATPKQPSVAARSALADLLGVARARHRLRAQHDPADLRPRPHRRRGLGPGDEVVVTRLDHDANVRPWVMRGRSGRARRCAGPTSTRTPPSCCPSTSRRGCRAATRLVAVTARLEPDRHDARSRRDRDRVHDAGALALRRRRALHRRTRRSTSPRSAPTSSPARRTSSSGRTAAWSPARVELLEQLHPDKLLPSTDAVPERFELGTLPYELMAGTTAAVDFLAGSGTGAARPTPPGSDRRRRWRRSRRTRSELRDADRGRRRRAARRDHLHSRAARPHAHAAADLRRHDPRASRALPRRARASTRPAGIFYAYEPARRLGLGDGRRPTGRPGAVQRRPPTSTGCSPALREFLVQ